MARSVSFLSTCLALGLSLPAGFVQGQDPGREAGPKGGPPPAKKGEFSLSLRLKAWSRTSKEVARRLAPSLIRLNIWSGPFAPPSRATGVVVRPRIVVTLGEVVEGSDLILGETAGNGAYSIPLRILGFSGPLAVLEIPSDLPDSLSPLSPGDPRALPDGAMVLLAEAGEPGGLPLVFLLPLARRKVAPRRVGGERGSGPVYAYHLKGFYPSPEARGGAVCDTSLRWVGLLRPRSLGGFTGFPSLYLPPVPGRPALSMVPVGRVLAAVRQVLAQRRKGPGRIGGKGERPFVFGVVLLPGMILEHVILGSPAWKAGLVRGDKITQFDGVPVKTLSAFREVFARSSVGKKKKLVRVEVERNGRRRFVEVRFP